MMGLDDALVASRGGVFLLRTFLGFWKKRALRNIETSEKLLSIQSADMDYLIVTKDLPVVVFTIAVEKKIYLKLRPQRILLELSCDSIPLKTFSWDRSYNIEGVKDFPDIEAPDIEAIDDGKIIIRYPCVNVFYSHRYIHKWELKGKVTFHSEIGDINRRGIKLTFQLGNEKDKEKEEKLKKAIEHFQKFYIEGGYKPVS